MGGGESREENAVQTAPETGQYQRTGSAPPQQQQEKGAGAPADKCCLCVPVFQGAPVLRWHVLALVALVGSLGWVLYNSVSWKAELAELQDVPDVPWPWTPDNPAPTAAANAIVVRNLCHYNITFRGSCGAECGERPGNSVWQVVPPDGTWNTTVADGFVGQFNNASGADEQPSSIVQVQYSYPPINDTPTFEFGLSIVPPGCCAQAGSPPGCTKATTDYDGCLADCLRNNPHMTREHCTGYSVAVMASPSGSQVAWANANGFHCKEAHCLEDNCTQAARWPTDSRRTPHTCPRSTVPLTITYCPQNAKGDIMALVLPLAVWGFLFLMFVIVVCCACFHCLKGAGSCCSSSNKKQVLLAD